MSRRLDWAALEREALKPEKREAIRALLDMAYRGRDLSAAALAQCQSFSCPDPGQENERKRGEEHVRAQLVDWHATIDRIQKILRDSSRSVAA